MELSVVMFILLLGCASAAPASETVPVDSTAKQPLQEDSDDLKVDASSSYGRRYSDWAGYPGTGYNTQVTGYGLLEDNRYSPYNNGVYDNIGYKGYDRGYTGINGYAGYGGGGYKGYVGYDASGVGGGYGQSALGNGGYGGYGGNGGVSSYYGYNNPPYYQSTQHLGYGYYNKKLGYGNIYNGITPNLVTGYRGYSRR